MNSLMRLPTLVGMLLLCHGAIACTASPPLPSTSEDVSVSAPAAPATGWADILGPTSAPDPWQVEPCDNPVLLCVTANGAILGTVERFSYPFSEAAGQGGAPTTPEAQRQFLEAWVADHYEGIRTDRAGADPNLQFSAEPPELTNVGSRPGLRYGYTITHSKGMVFDRTVGYVATDGDQVYVFVTGVISGDPTGFFAEDSDLSTFEPHLDNIIAGLRL